MPIAEAEQNHKKENLKFRIEMVLVGYWPLNESSGSRAHDYSGNENHGTIKDGGDSTVPGQSGGVLGQNGYSFDGSNDYIDISHAAELPDSALSIAAWVSSEGFDDNHQTIVDKGSHSTGAEYSLLGGKSSGWTPDKDQLVLWINGDSSNLVWTPQLNTGEWYHIVATFDGEKLRMFTNGELVDSTSKSTSISSNTESVFLGKGVDRSAYDWDGDISEIRIYNHALTVSEVQYLYQVSQRGQLVSGKKTS